MDESVNGVTAAQLEIGVVGCWNARALLKALAPYRPFLVEHGPERWVVHAQAPGCRGEDTATAIAAIEECLAERGVAVPSIRIDGRQYRSAARARSLV